MKRKKQLLSWVLSFLMVFSIMPMISISAFATEYDAESVSTVGKDVYPGNVIKGSNDGLHIMYFNNEDDRNNGIYAKDVSIGGPEAVTGYTIVSSGDANLTVPDGYVLDGYNVGDIYHTGGIAADVYLIANWKEIKKITYNMTNVNVLSEDTQVENGDIININGETCVTTRSSVTISLQPYTGYELPDEIDVEMDNDDLDRIQDDSDIDEEDYSYYTYDKNTGEVYIHNITANVKITAVADLISTIGNTKAIDINKTGATLNAEVVQGGDHIIGQGFQWKATNGGTYAQIDGTLNDGNLQGTLTGLTKNTSYTVRAFIITNEGTYYSSEVVFTTKNDSSSSASSHKKSSKLEILEVEPYETPIINALNTSNADVILTKIDSNPNLLLSKSILDALYAHNDKTFIIVANEISTSVTINKDKSIQFKQDGKVITGFQTVCNGEYYLNEYGIVEKGLLQLQEDKTYYFNIETGIREIGWFTGEDNSKYYLNTDGSKAIGWVQDPDSGLYYYMNDNGVMMSSIWVQDYGKWYFLKEDGSMATGWLYTKGAWYFLNSSGAMQTGWIEAGGKWYYSNASGVMLSNTIVDEYVLGIDGAWIV